MHTPDLQPGHGLGIDAGGTETRWAIAAPGGQIVAEGRVAGLSALQMASAAGREAVHASFAELARAARAHARPRRIRAGLTGFGGDGEQLRHWLSELTGVPADAIAFCSDIEVAYLASFAPGAGYLVYAGTGSIGAFIDRDGQFHRAGGRGVLLDDGGGGYWIAREALRHIWRNEDEHPGSWQASPMAGAVFEHIGGADWALSRQFVYGQERGEIGKLALAVAGSADRDPVAAAILRNAGRELARLALALTKRFGPRPVALSGRAAALHPMIADAMRCALPADIPLAPATGQAHHAAARLAAHAP
jgi:N-acetylglucosamine kinase-like BadF-type ATPase